MLSYQEMTLDDYDAVIALWNNTESMLLREADSKVNIGRYLKRNEGLSFVARNENRIVGAVLVGTDGRRGYLQHLAVDSSMRGQGVGKALIAHSVAALREQGVGKTHLFVANDNLNAQQFYDYLGWQPRDEVRMFSFNASDNHNL